VPDSIDLAVIAVPVELVLPAVEQCGRKGVRSLVVISSGFGEAGPDGAQRERLLREKVLAYGMRLIGPNCLGILNTDPAVRLNATFAATPPSPGNVSIGSQSGALGLALLDAARGASLGIAQFVSIGNRADISNNDLLEFWEDDASTQVILLYVESFGNPRNFSRIARRVSHKKPVIALKAGRSAAGAKAAASHTGALAATDIAVDALFRQAGVIRVDTMKEMLNVAALLAHQPLPRGPRVGILTNAGGPGILAADACEAWGLTVPTLSQETQDRLRALLPAQAAIGNPVDMIASATSEVYRCCLSVLLEDDGLDSLLVIYIPPLVTRPQDIAAAIREAVSSYQGMKPVLVCFLMAEPPAARLDSQPGRPLPFFPYPEDAVQALAHAYRYSQHQAQEEGTVPRFADVEKDNAQHLIATVQDEQQGAWLLPEQAVALLRAYRLPVVDTVVAASAQEAALAAEKLGAPVAMKVRSNTIVHKTDVGGVALGLGSPREVEQAYMAMEQRLREVGRGHEMQGVVLQPMVRGGQELIIGMSHDPSFGPLVMVGFGGVLAELVKDVAFSLHPLTDQDPDHMLHQLKSYPALAGWRGSLPRDIPALKELLLRFSTLIEDFPQIAEIEMNPLLLFEQGKGCLALDARVLLKGR
jgi:acetyltransferase